MNHFFLDICLNIYIYKSAVDTFQTTLAIPVLKQNLFFTSYILIFLTVHMI